MGFLHKLWDETLAGPAPDSGLGKLRKYDSFSAITRHRQLIVPDDVAISRSITILRSNSNVKKLSIDTGSVPVSPAGSSNLATPFTPGTPPEDFKRFTRRKPSAAETLEQAEPRSPTVYDWLSLFLLQKIGKTCNQKDMFLS